MASITRGAWFCILATLFLFGTATAGPSVPESQSDNSSLQKIRLTSEILSDTRGVDLKNYLSRLEASVKRNWFTIMPESALLGTKGTVIVVFHVQRNGTLIANDPKLQSAPGNEAFDKAAVNSIRNSAPFERLPDDLQPRNIEIKIIFYYNRSTAPPNDETHRSKNQGVTQITELGGMEKQIARYAGTADSFQTS